MSSGDYSNTGAPVKRFIGFHPIRVRSDDPRTRPVARTICCESCERPLALVQNFVRDGLANVEIACACGVVTAIALVATRRA